MRALTLTQPWAGLVASGIKRIENRPRPMIKEEDFGQRFAIHASREIDRAAWRRIIEIAPECALDFPGPMAPRGRLHRLSAITSAVIGVATIDKVFKGGWDAEAIARHAADMCFSNGEPLGPEQVRWFFGPVGYALRDIEALRVPVPIKGRLGFWTLPTDAAMVVNAQVGRPCGT